jgi:phosphopantothenoylcysteine decarboxylase/phosphopantothenate--cysteine ligase
MWSHPATQRNVAQLQADGTTLLGPDVGEQACLEFGEGRMLEAVDLRDELIAFFQPKILSGKRVLVTAGPTCEAIDPVRGITNHSSGTMGFAITPRGVRRIDIESARQMHAAVMPLARDSDVFVATAAVADWRPAQMNEHKIKKDGKKVAPTFELTENEDILADVARLDPRPYCVGFAAESENLLKHARDKLLRKNVPLIVGNLGPATFGRDDNALVLVDADGDRALAQADKLTLARQLVQEIAARIR